MRHHNAASPTTPCMLFTACCIFNSHSIILPPFPLRSLRHSLPRPRPARADGDCKARWRIPASQSVSACRSPIRGKRPESFPALRNHICVASACASVRENKNRRNGSEWQHVNRDRQRESGGITVGGINQSGDAFFFFLYSILRGWE